jgi:tetraacyldisaccharide 4'-kinase
MSFSWQDIYEILQAEPGRQGTGMALRLGAAVGERLYGLGASWRRALYDRGWLRPRRLPCPVLSIGNLTVGGTGKTPMTAYLAQRLQAAGCRVAILSRGYGGRASGSNVVSDGQQLLLKYPAAGDEACLLAQKLPGIPVVTGSDRFQAGLLAREKFHPDLFLLDDGFQHFQLYRDLDAVLLDAARPFGNGRLLPRGSLREPVATLRRPLVLILTRYESGRHHSTWESVRAAFPAAAVIRSVFTVSRAHAYPGGQEIALADLSHLNLAAMAGLARPEVFAAGLEEVGIKLRHFMNFPDHHPYNTDELARAAAETRRRGADGLVTTAKDWVRLADIWNFPLPLFVVQQEVKLLDPWPAQLLPLGCAQTISMP